MIGHGGISDDSYVLFMIISNDLAILNQSVAYTC